MSADRFPEQIALSRLFARHVRVKGSIAVDRLVRLGAFLSSTAGSVEADLQFAMADGQRVIQGIISADVYLACQRCLEAMPQRIASSLELNLDAGDDIELAALIEQAGDARESRLNLLNLVEDELILSLPIAPSHADRACSARLNLLNTASQPAGSEKGSYRPFAVLAALKSSEDPEQQD